VRNVAGLENVRAGASLEFTVADADADHTVDDVRVLVLLGMHVGRHENSRLDRMLDHREEVAGLLTPELEVHSQAAEPN